jgi:hypothetical protein
LWAGVGARGDGNGDVDERGCCASIAGGGSACGGRTCSDLVRLLKKNTGDGGSGGGGGDGEGGGGRYGGV